jgi:hypothetical protein
VYDEEEDDDEKKERKKIGQWRREKRRNVLGNGIMS